MDIPVCMDENDVKLEEADGTFCYLNNRQAVNCENMNLVPRNLITLSFPGKPQTKQEERVQKYNYDCVVHTMGELMQKYEQDFRETEM